ncbi:MAG: nucleotidyltransferase family protein [Solirubrobacteraceae bacterium]
MQVSAATLQAARAIALDAALAEVAGALHEQGIRPLLIKGPAVASWLYDDPGERPYADLDLLVAPDLFQSAGTTLARLGFRDTSAGLRRDEGMPNESAWMRAGERCVWVDLHNRIFLISAQPAIAWARLSHAAQPLAVAGVQLDTPSPSVHLVILALHAAHHGAEQPKPLADLRRAIDRVDLPTWQAAGALATELSAAGAMREGLKLVADGCELADRLMLVDDASRLVRLRARSAPDQAAGIERLMETRGVRARLALLISESVPSVAFMRLWQPLARRGWLGLSIAYLWRPFWLLAKLPRALAAWSAVALRRGRLARMPGFLRGAWWGLRAWLVCRAQLRRRGLSGVSLPRPAPERPGALSGVHRALARLPSSCLERSLIRQRWHAAQGRPRDVVIGVRGPAAEFGAHAWLDGDPPDPGGFEELRRWPVPQAR